MNNHEENIRKEANQRARVKTDGFRLHVHRLISPFARPHEDSRKPRAVGTGTCAESNAERLLGRTRGMIMLPINAVARHK